MKLPPAGAVHDQREIDAVVEVLRTSQLDIGEAAAEMERRTAALLAKQHGVMVNSGSSALRLAIDLLRLEPGDEVITSPLTFSTDIAPLVQSGLIPVFVDVDPASYQIDPTGIEAMIGPRTKAILVPNLCGNVPDWDAIRTTLRRPRLRAEDSCDVLDSWLRGTRTGTRSDLSVTSFARSHAITAGGNGGMVGVDDEDLLDQCVSQRRWGRRSESYLFGSRRGETARFGELADGTPYDLIFVFDSIGYNFEPSEIGAAYGLVQLDKLPQFNGQRRANWTQLDETVATLPGVGRSHTTDGAAETTWMRACVTVEDDAPWTRSELQDLLEARGVATRMVWTGNVLRQPGFAAIEHRQPEAGLPNCDHLMDHALSLPIHHGMDESHMTYICDQLREVADLVGRRDEVLVGVLALQRPRSRPKDRADLAAEKSLDSCCVSNVCSIVFRAWHRRMAWLLLRSTTPTTGPSAHSWLDWPTSHRCSTVGSPTRPSVNARAPRSCWPGPSTGWRQHWPRWPGPRRTGSTTPATGPGRWANGCAPAPSSTDHAPTPCSTSTQG